MSDIDNVWNKMSKKQQDRHLMLSLCGTIDFRRNVIMMGSTAVKNLRDYEQKMLEEYGTK